MNNNNNINNNIFNSKKRVFELKNHFSQSTRHFTDDNTELFTERKFNDLENFISKREEIEQGFAALQRYNYILEEQHFNMNPHINLGERWERDKKLRTIGKQLLEIKNHPPMTKLNELEATKLRTTLLLEEQKLNTELNDFNKNTLISSGVEMTPGCHTITRCRDDLQEKAEDRVQLITSKLETYKDMIRTENERGEEKKSSLIDDYANPNLEQPSYMDPED